MLWEYDSVFFPSEHRLLSHITIYIAFIKKRVCVLIASIEGRHASHVNCVIPDNYWLHKIGIPSKTSVIHNLLAYFTSFLVSIRSYDNGVTGGVTAMESFLNKFFPNVYLQEQNYTDKNSAYCKFDDQILQLFTSSLFIAGLIARWDSRLKLYVLLFAFIEVCQNYAV